MITQFLDKTRDLVFKALFKRVIITRVSLDEYIKFLEPIKFRMGLSPNGMQVSRCHERCSDRKSKFAELLQQCSFLTVACHFARFFQEGRAMGINLRVVRRERGFG